MVLLAGARHDLAGSVSHGDACRLTDSATGMIFAAFGDPEAVRPVMHRELKRNRRSGRIGVARSEDEFSERVAEASAAGVATAVRGGPGGTDAVSAPVFDATGRLVLALSVFGREGRLDVSPKGPLVALLRSAASALSCDLGARPPAVEEEAA